MKPKDKIVLVVLIVIMTVLQIFVITTNSGDTQFVLIGCEFATLIAIGYLVFKNLPIQKRRSTFVVMGFLLVFMIFCYVAGNLYLKKHFEDLDTQKREIEKQRGSK